MSNREQTPEEREAALRNLDAGREMRGATKHGLFTVIKSDGAELPAVTGAAAIAGEVDNALAQIETDLGGDLSGAQKEILRACRVPMIVLRLTEGYLLKNDIVDKRGRPRGLLKVVGVYANTLRHNLVALGLGRVPKQIESLETIANEYAEKANGENEN